MAVQSSVEVPMPDLERGQSVDEGETEGEGLATCKGVGLATESDDARSPLSTPAIGWLLLQRGCQLEIADEAQDIFRAELGYVNPVMICGRLRTGKSYLMNALLDRTCFGVSSQPRSFTKGINLAPELLPAERFGAPAGSPRVALLDVEGQGDKGIAQDVKLATPLLLVSKAVILVELCPTGPSKESILESLQVMMNAAEYVSERQARKNLFGCLHIVLRDCAQDEAECGDIIFSREDDESADTDEHAAAIQRRNRIRAAIALAFEAEPKVWCLPKLPHNEAPSDYRSASPEFAAKVDALRAALGSQLATPKLLDSRPLTGAAVAALMPAVAAALSSGAPALNPPALMDRVGEAEIRRAAEEFAARAEEQVALLGERLPLEASNLRRELAEVGASLREELGSRVRGAVAAGSGAGGAQARDAEANLASRLDLLGERLLRRNGELLVDRARAVEKELVLKVHGHFNVLTPTLELEIGDLGSEIADINGSIKRELDEGLGLFPAAIADLVRDRVLGEASLLEQALRGRCSEMAMAERCELMRRRCRKLMLFGIAIPMLCVLGLYDALCFSKAATLSPGTLDSHRWEVPLRYLCARPVSEALAAVAADVGKDPPANVNCACAAAPVCRGEGGTDDERLTLAMTSAPVLAASTAAASTAAASAAAEGSAGEVVDDVRWAEEDQQMLDEDLSALHGAPAWVEVEQESSEYAAYFGAGLMALLAAMRQLS